MSDTLPSVDLGLTAAGDPVVLVGESGAEAHDMAALLRLAPGVALPGHARDAAVLVNHLAQGNDFRVITDPSAFEQAYKARLASEDPAAPFREGVRRLRDFGVPDFGTIAAPRFEGATLVFFAEDVATGLPYRVTVPELSAAPDYAPLPLTPLPPAARPAEKPDFKPATAAERARRQSSLPSEDEDDGEDRDE